VNLREKFIAAITQRWDILWMGSSGDRILPIKMVHFSVREWEIAGAAAGAAVIGGIAVWLLTRKRPSPDELEAARRDQLISFGRIVDGMLLDHFQIESEDGTTREMLLYQYEISGVTYECSQDVTLLREIVDPATVKVGMPCSIRYQPGIPENSVLVAERWSGIRETVPLIWLVPQVPNQTPNQNRRALAG
jgi:hypothetical protein